MNLRIAQAFWFYHATRTWPFLFAGLALSIGTVVSFGVLFRDEFSNPHNFLFGALFAGLAVQFLGMLYNASFTSSLSCRLPESTLLLPATSFSIAFHRFAFNLTTTAVTTLVLYALVRALFGEMEWAWWDWLALTVGLCAFLQAVALATAPTGDLTLGFLFVATIVYLAAPKPYLDGLPLWSWHLFASILCFLAMWANVHFIRQGRGLFPASTTRPVRRTTMRTAPLIQPFKSAWRAQLWLEMRSYWQPISRIYIALIALFLFIEFFVDNNNGLADRSILSAALSSIQIFTLGYLGFAATAIGALIASIQNRRMQVGPMAAFVYLRPLSTPQLAAARIAAVLCLWTIAAVFTFSWVLLAYNGFRFRFTDNYLANSIIAFTPMAVCIWAAFWTWNMLALVPIYCAAAAIALLLGRGDGLSEQYFLEVAVMLLLIGSVCAVFWFALRRRLMHWKLLWGFPAAMLALIFPWIYLSRPVGLLTSDTMYNLCIVASAYAIAIAPIATVPLAHHWCRHR